MAPIQDLVDPTLTLLRAFNIGEFVAGKAQQPLPEALQTREEQIRQFADLCRELCMKLLGLFATGLKVRKYFHHTSSRTVFIIDSDPSRRRWEGLVFFSTCYLQLSLGKYSSTSICNSRVLIDYAAFPFLL